MVCSVTFVIILLIRGIYTNVLVTPAMSSFMATNATQGAIAAGVNAQARKSLCHFLCGALGSSQLIRKFFPSYDSEKKESISLATGLLVAFAVAAPVGWATAGGILAAGGLLKVLQLQAPQVYYFLKSAVSIPIHFIISIASKAITTFANGVKYVFNKTVNFVESVGTSTAIYLYQMQEKLKNIMQYTTNVWPISLGIRLSKCITSFMGEILWYISWIPKKILDVLGFSSGKSLRNMYEHSEIESVRIPYRVQGATQKATIWRTGEEDILAEMWKYNNKDLRGKFADSDYRAQWLAYEATDHYKTPIQIVTRPGDPDIAKATTLTEMKEPKKEISGK